MKKIILALLICNSCFAEDIKPSEIKEMIVVGGGNTINESQNAVQQQIYNSCKRIESVSNRNSQWTGAGWITTMEVKYKVVH
jgi:hypothetical protein